MNEKKSKFKWSYLIIGLIVILMFVLLFTDNGYKGEYLDGNKGEITQLIKGEHKNAKGEEEQLAAVYYKDNIIYFLVKGSKYEQKFPNYADYYIYYEDGDGILSYVIDEIDTQNKTIVEAKDQIKIQKGVDGINWWNIIYPILYLGFGIFLVWTIFRVISNSNKGAMGFGKSKAKAYTSSKVKFSDIAGTEEEKEELKEIVEFLKAPKKFTDLGARIPKGVLLVGHPGTGKTLLARAVAGEANVPFISISGSDFVEMFVGVGASRVRDLFEQAKKNKPCIVLIDEIDAVGRQRGAGLGGGNDEREQTLNQLLVEMDGFESNEGIIILAATNRSDVLDPALMRPGRFDRQIYVNVPDVKGREGILRIHARNKPIDENVDFKTLAKITVGFTGADIENMLNEAAILAAREGRPKIVMSDITEGINKVTMGPQKKSRLVTERDKKITAFHESGHAILATKLEHTDKVQEVSIIPRGSAGGYTMQRPENDNSYRTYNYLMDEIAVCMGGRIAEDIIFKDITTGASSDISQATKIAKNMVYNWGMSKKLGFLSLDSSGQVFIGRDYQTKNEFSEKLAAQADDEVRAILDYNYKRATKILNENISLLNEMSTLLLDQETINKEEVDMLLEGKTAVEVSEFMEKRNKEQKEKEEQIRKEQAEKQKKEIFEKKLIEGQRLLQAGIITKEEYDALVTMYEKDSNEPAVKENEKLNTGFEIKVNVTTKEADKTVEKSEEKVETEEVEKSKEETTVETEEEKPVEEKQENIEIEPKQDSVEEKDQKEEKEESVEETDKKDTTKKKDKKGE